ncbi:MAG TPA: YncE family protein [Steroidobacteraceae bacterium]|nr:YncE family protein [Steroidobacteraceae bacterium]
MSNHRLPLRALGVVLCITGLLASAEAKPLYTVTKIVPIGAPDRWDLLTFDTGSHRVYIAHGDRVTVVDGKSGELVGSVEGYSGGTHGVVIVPDLGRGYTDDGRAGTAGSFDVKTLKPLHSIQAEADADALIFDPVSGHVFVVDSDPGKITVIDPKTDTAIATIDGGGKLEIGAADGAGKVYVNGEAKQEILRIDTRSNQVDARWPIPACASPHGIAIDTKSHRVFSSCENNVMVVVDADSGKPIASLPIGSRTDGAAFDSRRRRAFSSNGDGTLTVIGEKGANSFVVLGNVPTMLGARTMTVDPKSGRLYLVAADIKINEAADPKDYRHRYSVTPGSAKLLVLDPN